MGKNKLDKHVKPSSFKKKPMPKKSNSWIANAVKSVGLASVDVIGEMMPSTIDVASTTASVGVELAQKLKEARSSGVTLKSILSKNYYVGLGKDILKNSVEDLKTGKFYNKERLDEMHKKAGGFDDFDFDFDFDDSFDIDDGGYEADEYDEAIESADGMARASISRKKGGNIDITNVSMDTDLGPDSVIVKATEFQSETTVNVGRAVVEANEATSRATLTVIGGMRNEVNSLLSSVNENISTIATTITESLSGHTSLSAKFYEDSINIQTQILEHLKSDNSKSTTLNTKEFKDYKDVMDLMASDSDGALDVKAYKDLVKKQFGNYVDNNMFLSQIKFFHENRDSFQEIAASPFRDMLVKTVRNAIPKKLQNAMENFDYQLKETPIAFLNQLNGLKRSQNPIFNAIGSIFGIQNKMTTKIDKSAYNKGAMAWTGLDHQAITTVIPTLLRKILASVSGEQEIDFDYEGGVFRKVKDIEEEYNRNLVNRMTNNYSDYKSQFRQFINDNFTDSDENKKIYSDNFEKFIIKLVRDKDGGRTFRLGGRDGTKLDADGNNKKDDIKELLGAYSSDDKNVQLIRSYFNYLEKHNPIAATQFFGSKLQEQRAYVDKTTRDIQKDPTRYNAKYINTGVKTDTHLKFAKNDKNKVHSVKSGVSIGAKDKYGNTPNYYLREILKVLISGIYVTPVQNVVSGPTEPPTSPSNSGATRVETSDEEPSETTSDESGSTADNTTNGEKVSRRKRRRAEKHNKRAERRARYRRSVTDNTDTTRVDTGNDTEASESNITDISSRRSDTSNIQNAAHRQVSRSDINASEEQPSDNDETRVETPDTQQSETESNQPRPNDSNNSNTTTINTTQTSDEKFSALSKKLKAEEDADKKREKENNSTRPSKYNDDKRKKDVANGKFDLTQDEINYDQFVSVAEIAASEEDEDTAVSVDNRTFIGKILDKLPEDSGIGSILNRIRGVGEKAGEKGTAIFNKLNKALFDVVFGDGEGRKGFTAIYNKAMASLKSGFSSFASFLDTKIFKPLDLALFGENGFITNLKNSDVAKGISDLFKNLTLNIGNFVLGSKLADGTRVGGIFSDTANALKGIGSNVKDAIFGVKGPDGKPLPLEQDTSVLGSMKRMFGAATDGIRNALGIQKSDRSFGSRLNDFFDLMFNRAAARANEWSNNIFGRVDKDGKEINSVFNSEFAKQFKTDMKGQAGYIGATTTIGLLSSFFLPGGPIGGALLGAGAGIVSKSSGLKDFLFGPDDGRGQGNRVGGLITKEMQDFFKDHKTGMQVGAVGGLLSSVGLLPSLFFPGGPIGGAILGTSLSLISKTGAFDRLLYGEGGTKDDPTGGIVKHLKEAFGKDKTLKGIAVDAGIGAGVGLLGSFFLPGGPLIHALLGSAISIGTATDKFKNWFFGEENENGKRTGGLFGRFSDYMKFKVFNPLTTSVKIAQSHIMEFVEENMVLPFKYAIDPLLEEAKHFKNVIVEKVSNTFNAFKESLHNVVVKPIGDALDKHLITPMKGALSKLFSGLGKLVGSLIAAPFKMFGVMGWGAYDEQRKRGRKTYIDNTVKNSDGGLLDRLKLLFGMNVGLIDRKGVKAAQYGKYGASYEANKKKERRERYKNDIEEIRERRKEEREYLKLGLTPPPRDKSSKDKVDDTKPESSGTDTTVETPKNEQPKSDETPQDTKVDNNTGTDTVVESNPKDEVDGDGKTSNDTAVEVPTMGQETPNNKPEEETKVDTSGTDTVVESPTDESPNDKVQPTPQTSKPESSGTDTTVETPKNEQPKSDETPQDTKVDNNTGTDTVVETPIVEQPTETPQTVPQDNKPNVVTGTETTVETNPKPTPQSPLINKPTGGGGLSPDKNLSDIQKDVSRISDSVYGQLNGVGKNINKIYRLLLKIFNFSDDDIQGDNNKEYVGFFGRILTALNNPIKAIGNLITLPFRKLSEFGKAIIDKFGGITNMLWTATKGVVNTVVNTGKVLASGLFEVVKGVASAGLELLKVPAELLKTGLTAVRALIPSAVKIFETGINVISDGFKVAGTALVTGATAFKEVIIGAARGFGEMVGGVFSAFGSVLSTLGLISKDVAKGAWAGAKFVAKTALNIGTGILTLPGKLARGIIGTVSGPGKGPYHVIVDSGVLDKVKKIKTVELLKYIGKVPGKADKTEPEEDTKTDTEVETTAEQTQKSEETPKEEETKQNENDTKVDVPEEPKPKTEEPKEETKPEEQGTDTAVETPKEEPVENRPQPDEPPEKQVNARAKSLLEDVDLSLAVERLKTSVNTAKNTFRSSGAMIREKLRRKDDAERAVQVKRGSRESVLERLNSAEREEEEETFKSRMLSFMQRTAESSEEHKTSFMKVFDLKKGLITAGIIMLAPFIIKLLKDLDLGDLLESLGEDISTGFDEIGGLSGIINNVKETTSDLKDAITGKDTHYAIDDNGNLMFDGNGELMTETTKSSFLKEMLMPTRTRVNTETGEWENKKEWTNKSDTLVNFMGHRTIDAGKIALKAAEKGATVGRIAKSTGNILSSSAKKIGKYATNKSETIGKAVSFADDFIKSKKGDIVNKAASVTTTAKNAAATTFDAVKGKVKTVVTDDGVISTAITMMKECLEALVKKFSSLGKRFGIEIGENALGTVLRSVKSILTPSKLKVYADKIGDFIKNITKKTTVSAGTLFLAEIGFALYGAVDGACNAGALFEVDSKAVDAKMRAIAAVFKGLLGTSVGSWVDLISSLVYEMLGFNFLKTLASHVYKLLSDDAGDAKLENAQAQFTADYEASVEKEYEAYVESMEAQGQIPMSLDEFKASDLVTTRSEYNSSVNRSLGKRVVDAVQGFGGTVNKIKNTAVNAVKNVGSTIWEKTKGVGKALFNGAKNVGSTMLDIAKKDVVNIANYTKTAIKETGRFLFGSKDTVYYTSQGSYYLKNGDTYDYYSATGSKIGTDFAAEDIEAQIEMGVLTEGTKEKDGLMTPAINLLKKGRDTIVSGFKTAGNNIINVATTFTDGVKSLASRALDSVKNTVAGKALMNFFVGTKETRFYDALGNYYVKHGDTYDYYDGKGSKIAENIDADTFAVKLENGELVTKEVNSPSVIGEIKNSITTFATKLSTGFKNAISKRIEFVKEVGSKALGLASSALESIKENGFTGAIVKFFSKKTGTGYFDMTGNYYVRQSDGTYKYFNGNGDEIASGIPESEVTQMLEDGLLTEGEVQVGDSAAKEAVNKMKSAISNAWASAKNTVTGAWSKLTSWLGGSGGDEITKSITSVNMSGGKGGTSNVIGGKGGSGEELNGMPYYSQNDPKYRDKPYKEIGGNGSEDTIGERGCGPTAMAMVASKVTGKDYDPTTMAKMAEVGGYSTSVGTTPEYFGDAATTLGISSNRSVPTADNLVGSLASGDSVILQGVNNGENNSPYTSEGHYVTATGIDGDTVIVNDPRGKEYSGAYKMNDVLNDTVGMWSFGGKGGAYGNSQVDSYYKSPRIGGFGATSADKEKWINVVREVKKAIAAQKPGYSQSRTIKITVGGKTLSVRTDCSGYVGGCLKFFGVLNDSANLTSSTITSQTNQTMRNTGFTPSSWSGWDSLQEGDIISRNGHVEIFAYNKDGRHYVYNCGSDSSVNSASPTVTGHSSGYTTVWRCGAAGANAISGSASLDGTASSSDSSSSTSVSSISDFLSGAASTVTNSILKGLGFNVDDSSSTGSNSSTGSYGGSVASDLSGSDNTQKIWNYLTNTTGLDKYAASGLMGCWQIESNNNPNTFEGYYLQGAKNMGGVDAILASNDSMNKYTTNVLFPAYAKNGLKINQSAYKGTDGNYYPGFGLAQWTGPRGQKLVDWSKSKGADWKSLETQLGYVDYELKNNLRGSVSTYNGTKSVEDGTWKAMKLYEGNSKTEYYNKRLPYAKKFYQMYGGGNGGTDGGRPIKTQQSLGGYGSTDNKVSPTTSSIQDESSANVVKIVEQNNTSKSLMSDDASQLLNAIIGVLTQIADNTGLTNSELETLNQKDFSSTETTNNIVNTANVSSNTSKSKKSNSDTFDKSKYQMAKRVAAGILS